MSIDRKLFFKATKGAATIATFDSFPLVFSRTDSLSLIVWFVVLNFLERVISVAGFVVLFAGEIRLQADVQLGSFSFHSNPDLCSKSRRSDIITD